uniref:RING-type E3 ubiquitin transferase n=1 Tax=Oryza nivara TaxID=4536 RepID=A0A0E0FFK2_ORYNI
MQNEKTDAADCGAPKRPRTTAGGLYAYANQQHDGEDETTETGGYSIERDALECGICFMPFQAEIYMCNNGHAACGSCCAGMHRACPSCRQPIGDIRCRPLEKAVAAISSPCKFRVSGCMKILGYTERRSHEASCPHAPCRCPFDGCYYQGSMLYHHIQEEHATDGVDVAIRRCTAVTLHRSKPFHVLLNRGGTRVFVLPNGGDVPMGRSLSLVTVGPPPLPPPPPQRGTPYAIKVGAVDGLDQLSISGTIPRVRCVQGFEAKSFLFVPDAYWGSSGTIDVAVTIG